MRLWFLFPEWLPFRGRLTVSHLNLIVQWIKRLLRAFDRHTYPAHMFQIEENF